MIELLIILMIPIAILAYMSGFYLALAIIINWPSSGFIILIVLILLLIGFLIGRN